MHAAISILAVPLGILILLLASGAVYLAVGTVEDRRRFPPPARLVRIHKRLLHIQEIGPSGRN